VVVAGTAGTGSKTYGSGATTKLEVDNNGTFETIWERDVNTNANERGGVISGEQGNQNKISFPVITPTNQLTFKSNKIRLTVGRTLSSEYNEIDSVQLTGSASVVVVPEKPYNVKINYANLENKPTIPTLPAEITDAQVTSGVGTDEVLLTPTKLKTANIVSSLTPALA
jgi:hypothetical protein